MKPSVAQAPHATTHNGSPLLPVALAALGIVFGYIGTSPLYALRKSFRAAHGLAPTPANVLGVLSLIFWLLIIVISLKYRAFILRADNQGLPQRDTERRTTEQQLPALHSLQ